jgi:hypothetical protein
VGAVAAAAAAAADAAEARAAAAAADEDDAPSIEPFALDDHVAPKIPAYATEEQRKYFLDNKQVQQK